MSILTAIVNALFGGGGPSGPDYGPFDPHDFARYHEAFGEIPRGQPQQPGLRRI